MTAPASRERVYRALLRLYPEPFRSRFGEELVQLFGDVLRDARDGRPGAGGVAATWLRILIDVALTAPPEHLEQRRVAHSLSRPASAATKALGILGIAGGLVMLASFVPFIWPDLDAFNARLIVLNVGTIAIVTALARRQSAGRSRLLSAAALAVVVVNVSHLVLIAGIVAQPGEPGMGSFPPPYGRVLQAVWLTGLGLGIVSLLRRIGSRPGAASLALGSALAFWPTLGPFTELIGTLAFIGVALVGLGWVLLGTDVATRRRSTIVAIPLDDAS